MEQCDDNQFQCLNGQCVNASLTCDFKYDCRDGSDEEPNMCGECSSERTLLAHMLLHLKFPIAISIENKTFMYVLDGWCKGFTCFSGTCLRNDLKNDMIGDCEGLAQEDERQERSSQFTNHKKILCRMQFTLCKIFEKKTCYIFVVLYLVVMTKPNF